MCNNCTVPKEGMYLKKIGLAQWKSFSGINYFYKVSGFCEKEIINYNLFDDCNLIGIEFYKGRATSLQCKFATDNQPVDDGWFNICPKEGQPHMVICPKCWRYLPQEYWKLEYFSGLPNKSKVAEFHKFTWENVPSYGFQSKKLYLNDPTLNEFRKFIHLQK